MSLIITGNEKLIKGIQCSSVKAYLPEGDGVLSESFYEQYVKSVCSQLIESAKASKSKTVAIVLQKSSNTYFSFEINTLLNILSDESVIDEDSDLEMMILIPATSEIDNVISSIDRYIAKPQIVTQNQSFGDYGDKLESEFRDYSDRLATQKGFIEYLCELIDVKGFVKYADVYRAAGISKFTFSKIMNLSKPHQPSKGTVAALSIGLRLNLDEAQKLYNTAGYYLGFSDLTDKIIRFFIEKQIYDINEVNYCLLHYDLPVLGERAREPKVKFRR